MALYPIFNSLLILALIICSSSGTNNDNRFIRASVGEQVLFGYCTADDCLFGRTPAFIPKQQEKENREVADLKISTKEQNNDGSKKSPIVTVTEH
mmetsp:Transcript_3277/g.4968  ORF Transcript_3277/g.4968 Transcript_3277/m.4968 type:complete len:95 (+) Transcript_3277:54-338(+)